MGGLRRAVCAAAGTSNRSRTGRRPCCPASRQPIEPGRRPSPGSSSSDDDPGSGCTQAAAARRPARRVLLRRRSRPRPGGSPSPGCSCVLGVTLVIGQVVGSEIVQSAVKACAVEVNDIAPVGRRTRQAQPPSSRLDLSGLGVGPRRRGRLGRAASHGGRSSMPACRPARGRARRLRRGRELERSAVSWRPAVALSAAGDEPLQHCSGTKQQRRGVVRTVGRITCGRRRRPAGRPPRVDVLPPGWRVRVHRR